MTGVVYRSLGDIGEALVVLDGTRRVYVAASRDGSYLHVIHPRGFEQLDGDGNVVGAAEDLVCGCKGGTFHGTCYRLQQAVAFEAGEADRAAAPAWMQDYDAPVGAGELVEASRG